MKHILFFLNPTHTFLDLAGSLSIMLSINCSSFRLRILVNSIPSSLHFLSALDQLLYYTWKKKVKYVSSQEKLSRIVRKPAFCICENKDADQLRGNREADQCLCFRYTDSTIPLLSKSEISSIYPSSVAV